MVLALEIASEQNVALRLKLLRIRRYFVGVDSQRTRTDGRYD